MIRVTDFYSNIKEQAFTVSIIPGGSPVGISPSKLEINLGGVPIDKYEDLNSHEGQPLVSSDGCTQQMKVRDCYRLLIRDGPNNWVGQGVTGVRFFFGMAGGYHSSPYIRNGTQWTYQTGWETKLGLFLADLEDWGIQRVTPTPVFDTWSGLGEHFENIQNIETCTGPLARIRNDLKFVPWLPYALEPNVNPNNPSEINYWPERTCHNDTYWSGTANPNFWGWGRFIYLMDRVLERAKNAGLDVPYLDYFQESNMAFTVEARMVYDNKNQTDVLEELRARMAAHGFLRERVAPSANNSERPDPGYAHEDCLSIYGDSAMVKSVSELMAAIAGPASAVGIGEPFDQGYHYGLLCGGTTAPPVPDPNKPPMITLTVNHTPPTFVDMHTQKTYPTAEDTAMNARKVYDAINTFVGSRLPPGSLVVIGETNPVHNAGCGQWTYQQASAMVLGTSPTTGYRNSNLYTDRKANVVMRPWQDTHYWNDRCTPSPNVIVPPFDPNHQ